MTKRFHHVTISVFLRENDKKELLDSLLPIPTNDFLEQQYKNDPDHERTRIYELPKQRAKLTVQEASSFDNDLTILAFNFAKITHTNDIFDTIVKNLSAEDRSTMKENILEFVDLQGKFTIRLKKPAFEAGEYQLADGGKSIQFAFLIAAYPKNERTVAAAVQALFA